MVLKLFKNNDQNRCEDIEFRDEASSIRIRPDV
jgi:hypothetical protein